MGDYQLEVDNGKLKADQQNCEKVLFSLKQNTFSLLAVFSIALVLTYPIYDGLLVAGLLTVIDPLL